jgi:predicted DNA-binding protein (MmcQ/YjbR family)
MTDNDSCAPQDEHPVFRALFEHARAKPDAVLDHPWGDTVLKVRGKIFVYLGRNACTVKPLPEELDMLLGRPDVSLSRYIGRFGWITLTIEDNETLELAKSLIDDTYDQIASKRGRERSSARREAPGCVRG